MSKFKLHHVLFALPLVLSVLPSACIAQSTSVSAPPLSQLQYTARLLLVFAPDSSSASYRAQLQMIERHSFELSMRNTVVVPVSAGSAASSAGQYSFENLPVAGAEEQAAMRIRFHILPGDFAVILLSQDGAEQIRSVAPVDIHKLVDRLDSLDQSEQAAAQTTSLTASLKLN
jgi:hypothetical protein